MFEIPNPLFQNIFLLNFVTEKFIFLRISLFNMRRPFTEIASI